MMKQWEMRDARWQEAMANRRIKEIGEEGLVVRHIRCGCKKCGVFCILMKGDRYYREG